MPDRMRKCSGGICWQASSPRMLQWALFIVLNVACFLYLEHAAKRSWWRVTRGVLFVLKTLFFSKKIQKQEILPCKKLLFSLSVQNEEIPYKNSGFGNFFVRNSLFLEFLHQTNLRVSEETTNAHGERDILPRCKVSQWEFSDEKWVAVLIRTGTAPVAIHGNVRLSRTSCSLHPVFQHFSRKYHHLPTNIFGRTFRSPWALCVLKIPWKNTKPISCYWFLYSSKVIYILNSYF